MQTKVLYAIDRPLEQCVTESGSSTLRSIKPSVSENYEMRWKKNDHEELRSNRTIKSHRAPSIVWNMPLGHSVAQLNREAEFSVDILTAKPLLLLERGGRRERQRRLEVQGVRNRVIREKVTSKHMVETDETRRHTCAEVFAIRVHLVFGFVILSKV